MTLKTNWLPNDSGLSGAVNAAATLVNDHETQLTTRLSPDELSATFVGLARPASGTGATDLANLQAAIAALPAGGGQLVLPPGEYRIPAAGLVIDKPVKLVGAGTGLPHAGTGTVFRFSGNGDAITITAHGCTIEDLAVVHDTWGTADTAPTAGTGIRVTSGRGTRLHRLSVLGFYDGVRFDEGYYYSVAKCQVQDFVRYGLHLLNSASGEGDHGDQIVEGCTIGGLSMSRIPAAAVHWESGGGLRFVGNKINGSVLPSGVHSSIGTGISIKVADAVSTSVFVIVGNSIEAWNTAGIDIAQRSGATGTGSIGKIVITGNEIAGNNGTAVAIHPAVATTFREAVIDGNTIGNCSGGILVGNIDTVAIGTNVYTALSSNVVTRLAGVTNFRMTPQVARHVSDGALAIYDDSLAGDTVEARTAQARWEVDRSIPDVTSESVYTSLFTFTVPVFTGALMRVTLSGNLNGVGAFVYDADVSVTRASGAVTAALVGSARTVGGAIDVAFDTSTSGTVLVKVRRAAGVGTKIQGMCGISFLGKTSKIVRH